MPKGMDDRMQLRSEVHNMMNNLYNEKGFHDND